MKVLRQFSYGVKVVFCAMSLMVSGCVGHHTSGTTAQLLDDKVIADRVQTALRQSSASEFARVQVRVKDGVVTLVGSVANQAAKMNAERLASKVENVRSVENSLQVSQPSSADGTGRGR